MASFDSHKFQLTRVAKLLNINKLSGWLWPVLLQVFLQILCQESSIHMAQLMEPSTHSLIESGILSHLMLPTRGSLLDLPPQDYSLSNSQYMLKCFYFYFSPTALRY